jgi:CRP/FNR family transcriptional regulator, anaerobic regulatory protein
MLASEQIKALDRLFPVLQKLTDSERQRIFDAGQVVTLPAQQMLMTQNQQCHFIPLVLKGTVRVFKLSNSGREMTLYRIGPGETCLISIACQINGEDYPALAQIEEKTQLCILPSHIYKDILDNSLAWKDYVCTSMYGHLTDIMQTLEAVAFERIDRRLGLWLLEKTGEKPGAVQCTHEAIAVELGTAREVISRLLGELKNKGLVHLGRGRIQVLDTVKLRQLVEN